MKLKRFAAIALLSAAALTTAACGQVVEPGNVGVMFKKFGGGVQQEALPQGWHMTWLGESITQYQVRNRIYTYGGDNRIYFADKNNQSLSGDIAVSLSVDPKLAPKLYETYRMDLDALMNGPIATSLITEIAKASQVLDVSEMMSDGRQRITAKALVELQKQWGPLGVNIQRLEWSGPINLPDSMRKSIEARNLAEANRVTAEAEAVTAEATARKKVAEAKGDADAARIRGQMLMANPGILEEQRIAKWKGFCPMTGGGNCILGAQTLTAAN